MNTVDKQILDTIISTIHHVYEVQEWDDYLFEELESRLDIYQRVLFLKHEGDEFEIWQWDIIDKHHSKTQGDDGLSKICTCNTRKKAIRIIKALIL